MSFFVGTRIWIEGMAKQLRIPPLRTTATTGQIKYYNGSAFVAKPVKVWNGSSWVTKPLKRWNGSSWVTTNY